VRMRPADDAEKIDTTNLEVAQVVERIEQMVRARTAA
jgi:cytidylate kinase